jgi:hypothetical protein
MAMSFLLRVLAPQLDEPIVTGVASNPIEWGVRSEK